jgi:hypothetical protein
MDHHKGTHLKFGNKGKSITIKKLKLLNLKLCMQHVLPIIFVYMFHKIAFRDFQ